MRVRPWVAMPCVAALILMGLTIAVSQAGASRLTAEEGDSPAEAGSQRLLANAFARFPAGLSFSLTAPPAFTSTCCLKMHSGRWIGPAPTLDGQPIDQKMSVVWRLDESTKAPSVDVAARRALRHAWSTEEAGVVFVPHETGGRHAGTIPASYVLTRAAGGSSYEMALALPLGKQLYATFGFESLALSRSTTAASGIYMIDGESPDTWIEEQLTAALAGIKLVGNLWPSKLTLGVRPGHAGLSGSALDGFGHPLAGVTLGLQRRSKAGRWVRVGAVRTSRLGRFTIHVPAGTYRVVAAMGGVTAHSRAYRV